MHKAALIAQLESQNGLLALLLDEATDEALETRPDEKWSARENINHLARHQDVFMERVTTILREENPRLTSYSAESDTEWPAWQSLTIGDAQRRFLLDRTRLLETLRSLDTAQLRRRAVHPVMGSMTLEAWFCFFILHASHHLFVAMKRARGAK